MEDWWLVRDAAGHCGWLLARQLDVDVPDEVGEYAEGQRMVGAYPIAKVIDSGAEHKRVKPGAKGVSSKTDDAPPEAPAPVEHTEYVTVLSPPRGGLPYDFDQMRVFTWSLNHHRYETAYRLHGIRGYLPVTLSQEPAAPGNGGPPAMMPVFSFAIADGPNVTVDPSTGVTRPVAPRMLSFRLDGNLVRRTGPDQAPIVLTHDSDNPGKAKTAATKKKH
jgi:hypothetical protein